MRSSKRGPKAEQAQGNMIGDAIRNGRLVWRLLRDPRIALPAKLVVPGLVGAYLLWPVDFVPDWLLVLGQLDDLALLLLGARLFVEVCPPEVVNEHREALMGRRDRPEVPGGDQGEIVDGEYRIIE